MIFLCFSDSPLDLQLKSSLICDVLTLVGIPQVSPEPNNTRGVFFVHRRTYHSIVIDM